MSSDQPTWDDFKAHTSACLATWIVLTIIGLLASSLRHKWDVERTSEFLTPFVYFCTENKYYLLFQMFGCLWMCLFYTLYTENGDTMETNKIVEVYVFTIAHAIEVLIIGIYTCAQSQEELIRLSFGRLFGDCILMVSLFLRGTGDSYFSFSFVAAMRFRMLWSMFEGTLDPFRKGLKVKIFHEAVLLLSVIFTASALFHNVESFTGEEWIQQSWKPWEEFGQSSPDSFSGSVANSTTTTMTIANSTNATTSTTSSALVASIFQTVTSNVSDNITNATNATDNLTNTTTVAAIVATVAHFDPSNKILETTNDPTEHWTISASLYAVLCTISTVGYGDVQPRTIFGQIMLSVLIVVGVGMMFYTVVGFLEGIQHTSRGGGEYHIHSTTRRRRHIVVVGTPSAQTVKELILEIYHPDHEVASQGLDTIVMLLPGQQGVMEQLKRFLHEKGNGKLLSKVWLLQGSPLHRTDLARAKLTESSMGYVLPNVQSADSEREDIENAMRALSMHRHAPYVRLVALLMKVEYKALMASVGLDQKDIACIDELKLGFMGKACVSQGFATFICNLFKSSGDYNPNQEEENWMGHYCRGMSNEIYEARLSPAYRGAPFGEVALDILQRSEYKAYMIGVIDDSRYPGEDPVIRIHPGRYFKIGNDEDYVIRGIFIAPDRECIQQHTDNKPFSWHLDKAALEKNLGGSMGGSHGNVPGQVVHPNDIPETLQRWLPNTKQIKRDYKKETVDFMLTTAVQRTVQGLKNGANMDLEEIEEIIDMKVPKKLWADSEIATVEDEAEMATDPRQKAMLQQQLRAARQQHKEQQQVKAEENTRREMKMRKMADAFVKAATADTEFRDDPHKETERELDDLLWGGPQTPRRAKWGNALEPPTSLLVRGEHIVVIALEGSEDLNEAEVQCHEVEPAGRKLGLEHFLGSVRAEVPEYAQRPVVVLSQRVPYDWPKVSKIHKDVYLIPGRPLAEENIRRAGINHAKAIVIYQRGPVKTHDPTLVDAQVIFGAVLAESLLERMGKEALVLVDLHLDANHSYVKLGDKKSVGYNADELSVKQARKVLEKQEEHYMKSRRFVTGQLFASSNAITSLCANMMYNPALGSLVNELLKSRFITLPYPSEKKDFQGTTFRELYEYMLRKRNLIAVGLLRRFDDDIDDDFEEDEAGGASKKKSLAGITTGKLFRDDEPPSKRYIYTMPEGDKLISVRDGVMCIAPKDDLLAYLD